MLKNVILLSTLILHSSLSYSACDQTGPNIIKKLKAQNQVKFESEEQRVILLDLKSKQKEERRLKRFYQKTGESKEKSLLNFVQPKEVKGTAVLSWSESNSDNQWLYIPSIKKLQRIASGSKKKYFLGTDFTYADLDGEIPEDNNYICEKKEKCSKGTRECYVVRATPKSEAISRKTGYSKRKLYIDTERFISYKIDFYNLKGEFFKFGEYLQWKKITNAWRPSLSVMERVGKHKTFMKVIKREINKNIQPLTFSKRFLEKEIHMK